MNRKKINARKLIRTAACYILVFTGITPDMPAGEATDTKQSKALYSTLDKNSDNGIRGSITSPNKPIQFVFASSQGNYKNLYKATIKGAKKQCFRIQGLPVGKYDLIVIYRDELYEGLTLNRGLESTLDDEDLASIEVILKDSTPFFNKKKLHRVKGSNDRHKARGVLQEIRTLPVTLQSAEVRKDIQIRSIKLALLKDTGIGWALMETREIVRQEVVKKNEHTGFLPHNYDPRLGNIRTVGNIRNLGELELKN